MEYFLVFWLEQLMQFNLYLLNQTAVNITTYISTKCY